MPNEKLKKYEIKFIFDLFPISHDKVRDSFDHGKLYLNLFNKKNSFFTVKMEE